ncbi:MAG TPA: hypothetical protein VGS22_08715 [Thermoanaerobaculia bacterium]|jgi:hypothetical protein|nr:hypothetical protein [Thermoanaerobaculia bacterium]
MRNVRLFLALVLSVFGALSAGAQSFSHNGAPPSVPASTTPPIQVIGATSITQSTNATTVSAGSSISCNAGSPTFLHTDNSYYRAFTLASFNPPLNQLQFMVQSVTIGIEQANAAGTGTTQPLTINIFSSSANPPTLATLGPVLSTVTVQVPDQTVSLLTIPLTTQPVFTVATGILVVEIFTPSGQAAGHSLFVGSNALGQSGPTFIRASSCGISEITNVASIGFPNMHLVMTVNGNSQMPVELQGYSVD